MKRLGILLVSVLVLSIALVACGEDAEEETAMEQPTAAPVMQPTTPPTAMPQPTAMPEATAVRTAISAPIVAPTATAPPVAMATEAPSMMMEYGEAPMLAELVAAGELPPVEERLPKNPLVVEVVGEIGNYGGTMRRVFTGARDTCNYTRLSRSGLVRWSPDGFNVQPNIATSWEHSDDGTEWTVTIREDLKWSDGAPMTADDFVFQVEDYALNADLRPDPPGWIKSGDSVGMLEKIDDITFKYTYPAPNFNFPLIVSANSCSHGTLAKGETYAPAHYLKQFHADYNADADANAKAAGLESWEELFRNHSLEATTPEVPSMRPWILENDSASQLWIGSRNPYWFGVDPEGNQLPYIDRLEWELVEDREVIQLKAASGDIDFQYRHIQTPKYPVFVESAEQSGIRPLIWSTAGTTAEFAFYTNQTREGEVGDFLRNIDARRGLSVAINRDSINEISFLGLAEPRTVAPPVGHPHSPGEAAITAWTQYDPELANELLDKVLPDRDADGFRMLPSGETLLLVLTVTSVGDVAEQAARDWEEVGIKSKVDVVARATTETRGRSNEWDLLSWSFDTACCIYSAYAKHIPTTSTMVWWGPGYGQWWINRTTGEGDPGVEPPPIVLEMYDLLEEGLISPPEKGAELAQDFYQILADQVYIIPIVGLGARIAVTNADMGNVPDFAVMDWPFRGPSTAYPEQFYYK